LQNQYGLTDQESETSNSFVFKNQIVNKITPSKNILSTLTIESDESFNQIRYSKNENFELLVAGSNNNPFTLKYCFISGNKLKFADFFNSKKEIFAWDFKENQLIILFSDLTVEHFLINLSNNIPTIDKQIIFDSIDEAIKRPVIQINPFKGSFLLWDAVANGKTWMLIDAKNIESYWCNINVSTHSSFINGIVNFQDEDSLKVFVGVNTVSKIDPRISLYSFFVHGNTQDNHSYQWLSIGTRTIDEKLFKKQIPTGQ
ncbi:MAG: hypothetical protein KAH01_06325, partial [Caldisericia bacterium]|nr:hypothetical protein [Caldisericia bacterium]